MKNIILAGGSGFLGRVLARHFEQDEVTILTRRPNHNSKLKPREVFWDGCTLGAWATELDGADAVINLSGRSVNCRYTAANRRDILASRIEPTRVLADAIAKCNRPPGIWLNASTATIYKHTFGPAWDEQGETGADPAAKDAFSIEVARCWEDAFFSSETPQTRKIALRTSMVLGCGKNSVFPVLQRLVRLGLGGRQGSGQQFVSWIHQGDFCRAIDWLLRSAEASGIYNLSAPEPLTNAEMMRILRVAFSMPLGLPAPRFLLELGAFFLRTETELVLKSRRVIPQRLMDSGFQFSFPNFQSAAQDLKGRCGQ